MTNLLYNRVGGDLMHASICLLGQDLDKKIIFENEHTVIYHHKMKEKIILSDDISLVLFAFEGKEKQAFDIQSFYQKTNFNQETDFQTDLIQTFDQDDLKNQLYHIVFEYKRIQSWIESMTFKDYHQAGQLIYHSFYSFKDLLNHTSQKEDRLIMWSQMYGALGANISNQNLVCMVEKNNKQRFIEKIQKQYKRIYKEDLRVL